MLRQSLDKLDQLNKESAAAQEYIASLNSAAQKDADLIKALNDRDQIRQDTIKALDTQVQALKDALTVSEKAHDDAVKEAAREKKRGDRWKKIAGFGTTLGLIVGAGAVLMLKH